VSLSSDGSRVAIGASGNDGNGTNSGHVRIYSWNGSAWTKLGSDIDGEAANDESGNSVYLSSDGSMVAIGAVLNSGNGTDSGHVRIYSWNGSAWTKLGSDIDGEAANDVSGRSVFLSSDGSMVAIGANGNGSYAGHVRVYGIPSAGSIYQYVWDVDSGGVPSSGTYLATVSGTASTTGGTYSGTDSITFTLDTSGSLATLTHSADDNFLALSEVVTITAGFSKSMSPTPTVSITGIVTNATMGLVNYNVTDPIVFPVKVSSSGGGNKYFINDQSQLPLVLVPGQTYRFDQSDSSNASHPIKFSTTQDGTHNSGSAYTTNVTAVGTPGQSGAYTLITLAANSPANLYYYCGNHSNMGGSITRGTGYYFTFNVSSTFGSGNYVATVSGTDSIGNPYVGTDSITFTTDVVKPSLTITTPSGPKYSNTSVVVTLTYDETVTGLTTNPLQFSEAINVASLTLLSVSQNSSNANQSYVVRITPKSGGLVKLTHAPGSPPVIDAVGNSISSIVSCSFIYDPVGPSVLLADSDQDNLLISTDTVTLTAFFSESMSTTPTISISPVVRSNTLFTSKDNGIVQIGQNINGQANDWLGFFSQVSDDGKTIVIGGMRSGGTGNGYAKVLRWDGSQWSQIGNTITGSSAEGFGRTVAISGNGQVIVIGGGGSNYRGKYGIYTLVNNTWTLRGGNFILGEADNDLEASGSSIDISYDGNIVAIGAPRNDGVAGNNTGHVRVYHWDGSNLSQRGNDIEGDSVGGQLGGGSSGVSLSADGNRLAIGAYSYATNEGKVRVYDWNGSNWVLVGGDIDDTYSTGTSNFGVSVSLSGDGATLVAGGWTGQSKGIVNIYKYEVLSGTATWTLKRSLVGSNNGDNFGYSSAINSIGDKIIVGAYGYSSNKGLVRAYSWDGTNATQIGSDIIGDNNNSYLGTHVDISSNGVFTTGAPYHSEGGTQAGQVEVFGINPYQFVWDVDNGNNTAPSDGSYAATVSGTDLAGNSYVAGTESITFTLDTSGPTVILTDTDADNLIPMSASVTIIAAFSESLLSTPTLSLSGLVTNALMTRISSTNSYTYLWSVSPTTNSGVYAATVSGSDLQGNYNSGTQSITFTVDSSTPTVTITTSDSDNTIKPGEQITITATFSEAMGVTPTITIGSAVNNQILSALSTKTYRYIWSTSGVTPTSYTVSVSGQDLSGNTYAGSDKITIRLDSTAPTVTLSDTDDDNFLASSDTVTITTLFNEAMTSTPTISITGVVTNVFMLGGTASFTASDIATSADGAHSVFAA
ncbi:Ig-like domain-containing protein, partial [Flavobacteriaceae bacterium]|nr:Ig-like domain-containing protein [Flavobacteriaceae bacterium]